MDTIVYRTTGVVSTIYDTVVMIGCLAVAAAGLVGAGGASLFVRFDIMNGERALTPIGLVLAGIGFALLFLQLARLHSTLLPIFAVADAEGPVVCKRSILPFLASLLLMGSVSIAAAQSGYDDGLTEMTLIWCGAIIFFGLAAAAALRGHHSRLVIDAQGIRDTIRSDRAIPLGDVVCARVAEYYRGSSMYIDIVRHKGNSTTLSVDDLTVTPKSVAAAINRRVAERKTG